MQISHIFLILSIIITLSLVGCASHPNPTPPLTISPGITPTTSSVLNTIKGDFRNQIKILENNMPRANSEGYIFPAENEQANFAELVSMINTDQFEQAVDIA